MQKEIEITKNMLIYTQLVQLILLVLLEGGISFIPNSSLYLLDRQLQKMLNQKI
jgi:hypothetical protein